MFNLLCDHFKSLATLGDPPINKLTSSFYVAEKNNLSDEIFGFDSFEAAIDAVREGSIEAALVAGAYPNIRDFIMDSRLTCIGAFVEQIPPLVLAGKNDYDTKSCNILYLHPATKPLICDININFEKVIETKATSAAASKAKHDKNSLAICNQLAADYYELTIKQVLRPSLNMPFAVFKIKK